MPSEGQGRFCAACSKTVVDLTGFSDQELLFWVAAAAQDRYELRVMIVNVKGQVDMLEIPASLAKGVYVLRVARAGEVRVLSRKLVVL